MSSPIINKLNELKKQNSYPFHMPGHKRNQRHIPDSLLSYDITELNGTDNLHSPTGIIKESQALCSELFGAGQSFYLVNGSTSGIEAAILALCKPNDKILTARNCHKSVYNGITLSHTRPIYIFPEKTIFNTYGEITVEAVEKALESEADIKAAVITSPTYEGICSDIKGIAEVLHRRNIPLITDEAHGAHFAFSESFPKTALSQGTDIAVQSLHKTLPALTQCSVLHVNKNSNIDISKLKQTISMLQTTSPSYILMASIDNCQNLLYEKGKELFSEYVQNLKDFRRFALNMDKIELFEKNNVTKGSNYTDIDIGKIVLLLTNKNTINVENYLIKDYNINTEMRGINHLLLMTSMSDSSFGFSALKRALAEIDKKLDKSFSSYKHNEISFSRPITVISPSESFYFPKESVAFKDSIGLISGEYIIPYPPGIPLVVPGELITSEILEALKKYIEHGIPLTGMSDLSLKSIQVHIGE